MQLKEFIKEALLNIVDGVTEANKSHHRFKIIGVKHESGTDGNFVDFDVFIIINESSSDEAKGKIGVSFLNVVSADIGSKMDQTNAHQNTHRLTFKVYITENEKIS